MANFLTGSTTSITSGMRPITDLMPACRDPALIHFGRAAVFAPRRSVHNQKLRGKVCRQRHSAPHYPPPVLPGCAARDTRLVSLAQLHRDSPTSSDAAGSTLFLTKHPNWTARSAFPRVVSICRVGVGGGRLVSGVAAAITQTEVPMSAWGRPGESATTLPQCHTPQAAATRRRHTSRHTRPATRHRPHIQPQAPPHAATPCSRDKYVILARSRARRYATSLIGQRDLTEDNQTLPR